MASAKRATFNEKHHLACLSRGLRHALALIAKYYLLYLYLCLYFAGLFANKILDTIIYTLLQFIHLVIQECLDVIVIGIVAVNIVYETRPQWVIFEVYEHCVSLSETNELLLLLLFLLLLLLLLLPFPFVCSPFSFFLFSLRVVSAWRRPSLPPSLPFSARYWIALPRCQPEEKR